MKLGLSIGYVLGADVAEFVSLAQEAERLGYSVAWAAEAYGSDAPTVLGYIAASTERIDVGAAVMQIPARTPAMTAMTAATLDLLSGGPVPARPRRLRTAGVGGLARGSVRQAAGAHPGVRRRSSVRRWPARRCATTASSSRCRCPTVRARRSS